jgi:hypothetical protein
MADHSKNKLIFNPGFLQLLGMFHGAWASVDMTADFAIGQFMKLPHQQTHLMTAGMAVGAKFRLLADLIGRSDHPKKSELLGALNKIRGETKREVLAHSYIRSSATAVTFLDRKGGGEYRAKEYPFSLLQFSSHVKILTQSGQDFEAALGADPKELRDFWDAAISANRSA